MKTLFLFLAMWAFSGTNTTENPAIVKDAICVNGLKVGSNYTREQFEQALGKPTKVVSPAEFDEYRNAYTFYYGDDRFYWIDGEFYGFDLRTPAFTVNGLIRIGDSTSKIDLLDGIQTHRQTDKTQLIDWRPATGALYKWLSINFHYDKQREITYITAFINDL